MRVKLLFSFVLWGISFSAQGQDTLTVMSYNIYHAENPETSESTLQEISEFFSKTQPAFVALQEVDSRTHRLTKINNERHFSLADSLADLTSISGYFGKTINFDGGEYGIAILSQQPFEAHEMELPNPQQGEPRVLQYLDAHTESGTEVIFANSHLDNEFQQNRLAQISTVNNFLVDSDKPVILAGDFNFEADSEGYLAMKSQWIDAETTVQDNEKFTFPSGNPIKRIDYIFLSPDADWQVIDCKVYDVNFSDHLPLVCQLVLD